MNREEEKGEIITECLKRILVLLAPVSLFITEKIWQNLKQRDIVKEESVHLCNWPKHDSKKINKKLEEEFSVALQVIEAGLRERDKEKIGLKWPLLDATYDAHKAVSKDVEKIIAKQINVKKLIRKVIKEPTNIKVKLNTVLTRELEAEGFAREIARRVQTERKKKGLTKKDRVDLKLAISSELKEKLSEHFEFIKERTGSSKIEFVDGKQHEMVEFEVKEEIIRISL